MHVRCIRNFCSKSCAEGVVPWVTPKGYDTNITVYNQIVKKKVPLIFPDKNYVKWYMCGPTVYDYTHIGHASSYIKFDIIHRILKTFYGISPVVAMGVTDVSVKIYEKAKELNMPAQAVVIQFEEDFFEQMKALNVLPPTLILRVSKHMDEIIYFIEVLLSKGAAYKGHDGSIYFDTSTDQHYGRFGMRMAEGEIAGDGRKSSRDFALWKTSPGKKGWSSPFGVGLPGWHIECSAMASYVFGETIDLHSGGMDLVFPHHENEEAQSTCYHGCKHQWVNYWLHSGLLNLEDVKMSKSLGNVIRSRDFLQEHSADHLRMLCLMSGIRQELPFDESKLAEAEKLCDAIAEFWDLVPLYMDGSLGTGKFDDAELLKALENTKVAVDESFRDGFSTADAVSAVMNLISRTRTMMEKKSQETLSRSAGVVHVVSDYVNHFFTSLGLTALPREKRPVNAFELLVENVVDFRSKLRQAAMEGSNRDIWMPVCDTIRGCMAEEGVIIKDLRSGKAIWSFKNKNRDMSSVVKNIIDLAVASALEVKLFSAVKVPCKLIQRISRDFLTQLAVLGIRIVEGPETGWTFRKADSRYPSLITGLARVLSNFNVELRAVAEAIPDPETRKEFNNLSYSLEKQLNSLGFPFRVFHNGNRWFMESVNVKNPSIVERILETTASHLSQFESVIFSQDYLSVEIKSLLKQCRRLQHHLDNLELYVDSNDHSGIWEVRKGNKNVLEQLLQELIMFQFRCQERVNKLPDEGLKRTMSSICNSLVSDLNDIGILVNNRDGQNCNWTLKTNR